MGNKEEEIGERRQKILKLQSLVISLLLMLLLFSSQSQFNLVPTNGSTYNVSAEPFNFAAVGDWSATSQAYTTAQNIDSMNPEIVLGLGDYAYEVNIADIRLWWDRMKIIHDDEIFIGALGNHDSDAQGDEGNNQDEDYYLELFQQSSNQSSWTYSYVYGGVLFVAINTEVETTNNGEQREQVINMLEDPTTNVDWKVVFLHKPILASESEHEVNNERVREYCQIFEENDVNLVLQAHIHNYQRSSVVECRDNEFVKSEGSDGFTIVTVGTGGRYLYDLIDQSPLIVRQCDDRFGFLNVDIVNNTQMKVQFIDNKNSQIADSFIINKDAAIIEDTNNSSEMC